MTIKRGRLLAWACLLLAVAGCGRDTPESLIREQTAAMEEICTVLDSIKDDATAEAAMPRLEKACQRARRAHERAAAARHTLTSADPMPDKATIQALVQVTMRMVTSALRAQSVAPQHAAKIADLVNHSGLEQPER